MCQVTDTREYLILGRKTAQEVYEGYITWSCTEVSLASVPPLQVKSTVALRPNSHKVNLPLTVHTSAIADHIFSTRPNIK